MLREIETKYGPVRLEYDQPKRTKVYYNEEFVGNVYYPISADEETLRRYCEYLIKVFNNLN